MSVEKAVNLDDLRILAKKRTPKLIYDFMEGGADDEDGLAKNEDAFRNRGLLPRYMVDVSTLDQSTTVFGKTFASAFGVAPMGGVANYRWDGDLMLARAAKAANLPYILSGAATASMEDIAEIAGDNAWAQIYTAKDRAIAHGQIERARELGYPVLVITVDVPVGGNRERNKRNGFGRPLKLTMKTKLDALRRPLWMRDYLKHGIAMLPNWQRFAPPGSDANAVGDFVATQLPNGSVTWDDIATFRDMWPGKLVIKGIMRVDDAERAASLGVDGLMVSNHGARQLDRAPSPLDMLPRIDAAVGDRMTLMLDGGVRRGSDVAIALASGAKFLFLGRPLLYGAVAGGDAGAAKAMSILKGQIANTMAQIGCPNLSEIGPDWLYDPDPIRRNTRA